ncbi:MAG: putative NAD/FAD-binding protein [Pseudohongiellaceae bacterium]
MQQFDEVIFACHSDQALAILRDASKTETETSALGDLEYQWNGVTLHMDTSIMPKKITVLGKLELLGGPSPARRSTRRYLLHQ